MLPVCKLSWAVLSPVRSEILELNLNSGVSREALPALPWVRTESDQYQLGTAPRLLNHSASHVRTTRVTLSCIPLLTPPHTFSR